VLVITFCWGSKIRLMLIWQRWFILVFGLLNLTVFSRGVFEVRKKNNPFGRSFGLGFLGIFVWGDAVIFGLFWCLTSLICLFLQDWLLFLLVFSIFWAVRSFGETIYWLNQQFSGLNRNPPETLAGFKVFKNDSVWFVYQIVHQCITVIAIISSIYLTKMWTQGIGIKD
jgi:hypothetical protein